MHINLRKRSCITMPFLLSFPLPRSYLITSSLLCFSSLTFLHHIVPALLSSILFSLLKLAYSFLFTSCLIRFPPALFFPHHIMPALLSCISLIPQHIMPALLSSVSLFPQHIMSSQLPSASIFHCIVPVARIASAASLKCMQVAQISSSSFMSS